MKLIRIINTRFFFAASVILILMGVSLTFVLSYIINEELEEKLTHSYHHLKKVLKEDSNVSSLHPFFEIVELDEHTDTLFFVDERYVGKYEKHGEMYKQLHAITHVNGKVYKIVIRESVLETDDLYETIVSVFLISIFLMLLVLYFINRRITQSVWGSFYDNLERIKSFSIQKQEALQLKTTNINEFAELNHVIVNLSNRVIEDYKNLKQFSEDASHELQTPLAIIRSKLESLIESNALNASQVEKIQAIYATVNRLTRLNKDLLLLTKIENKQFYQKEKIDINAFIENKINDWLELFNLHKIRVNTDFKNLLLVLLNPSLVDVLITNLLSNAMHHNIENGEIEIRIEKNTLWFLNSGNAPIKNPESIFNRFHKENNSKKSVGLGLSIVKKICEAENVKIEYLFINNMHAFKLDFLL